MTKKMLTLIVLIFAGACFASQRNPVLDRDLMGNVNMYFAFTPVDSGSSGSPDWLMQVFSTYNTSQHVAGLFVHRVGIAGKVRPGRWQNTFTTGRYKTLGAGTANNDPVWYKGWRFRTMTGTYGATKIITWNIPDGHNLIIVGGWGYSGFGTAEIKLGTADNGNTLRSELDINTIDFNRASQNVFDKVVATNSASTGRVITVCPAEGSSGMIAISGIRSYNTNAIGEPNEVNATDGLAQGNSIPFLHSDVAGNFYAGVSVTGLNGIEDINGFGSYYIYHDTDIEGNLKFCNPGGTFKFSTPLTGGHLTSGDAQPKSEYRTASSTATTYTATRCTDPCALGGWDLNTTAAGDYAMNSEGMIGYVTAVNSDSHYVDVNSWKPATPSAGTICNIIKAQNLTQLVYGGNYSFGDGVKKCMYSIEPPYGIPLGTVVGDANSIGLVDNIYSDFAADSNAFSPTNLVNVSISRCLTGTGYTWSNTYKFDGETDIRDTLYLGNFEFIEGTLGRVGTISFPPDTIEYLVKGNQGSTADFAVYGVNQWQISFYDNPYQLEFRTTVPLYAVYSQQLTYPKLYGNVFKPLLHLRAIGDGTTVGPMAGDSFSIGGQLSIHRPYYIQSFKNSRFGNTYRKAR